MFQIISFFFLGKYYLSKNIDLILQDPVDYTHKNMCYPCIKYTWVLYISKK